MRLKLRDDEKRFIRMREEIMVLQQENQKIRQVEKETSDHKQQIERRRKEVEKAFNQARTEAEELKL